MSARIDHLLLPVNDLDTSFDFYCNALGFERGGMHGRFEMVKLNEGTSLLLTQYATEGGMHLAFSFPESEFDEIFERIKAKSFPFGDRFDRAGNGRRTRHLLDGSKQEPHRVANLIGEAL